MGKPSESTSAWSKVYRIYRDDPESGKSSYLYDHYQRGLTGRMKPDSDQVAAHAAWTAGKDTSKAKP